MVTIVRAWEAARSSQRELDRVRDVGKDGPIQEAREEENGHGTDDHNQVSGANSTINHLKDRINEQPDCAPESDESAKHERKGTGDTCEQS